jgi:hypothetical protein
VTPEFVRLRPGAGYGRGDKPRVERAHIFFFMTTGPAMDISATRLAAQVIDSCVTNVLDSRWEARHAPTREPG